ncbi:hypothetical protein, partial [uncultured Bradyrhizobium sp.]|uniref:hypothetical protein n=1 Tax=uncultured Bradyrhizobium sp. TaxID=199684 RepID=UPI00262D99E1
MFEHDIPGKPLRAFPGHVLGRLAATQSDISSVADQATFVLLRRSPQVVWRRRFATPEQQKGAAESL